MNRVYNFSAGPSMLPEAVLRRAADEMLDYQGSGQSVMEMSHRSKVYEGIIGSAESLLREVMNIPDNYKVLFLQGGASSQFAMVPMNLMTKSGKADFVITGQWATKAYKEAARYGEANVVASSKDQTFCYIPELDPSTFTKDADYFHICMNNTIYGTKFTKLPETGAPLLNPATLKPMTHADLAPVFCDELIDQELDDTDAYIDIPEEIQNFYKMYRPSPLIRAYFLEKALDTPAKIYYKFEGNNTSGSHKLNSAIAQAYYAKKQGLKGVTTETGAGQWGTALSMACSYFGLDCKVFMVKVSYEQKPFRREVMRTYGASVTPSPSTTTEVGRKILEAHPGTTGSLGCAISEAVEVATHTDGYRYVLGSVLNQVLLHQSVIGLEAKAALEKYDVKPDIIIGCAGGGSNLGGLISPFMGEKLRGENDYKFIAVEPASCPSLTRGKFAYDFCDTGMICPLAKMYTLGSGFIPSVPVEIIGMGEVPGAGDDFHAVADERMARELVEQRKHEQKMAASAPVGKVSLEDLFSQIKQGEMKDLNIIVKADVQGSAEAVKASLEKLSNEEVRVRVIHCAVGAISESDVMLATTSNAIIVGFNVRPDNNAKESAARNNVDMRMYRVIYDCINEIETAMKGMLAPKFKEVELGQAEVRNVFRITGVGMVAGCYVTGGKMQRGAQMRLLRDNIVIYDGAIASLQRFKDSVKEVAQGYECGITFEKFQDIKEGDVIEAYLMEQIEV